MSYPARAEGLVNSTSKLFKWILFLALCRTENCYIVTANYTYTYACRNIFNTIKASGHSSLEKIYLSLYWKGSKGLRRVLLCEMWVGDWTELQHIDPNSYGHNIVSFPFSWAVHPRPGGPASTETWFSFQLLLSDCSELPVTRVI